MNQSEIIEFKQEYSKFMGTVALRVFNIHKNADSLSAKVVCNNLHQFLIFLKYDFLHQIKLFLEITAYDNPGKIFRFSLVYSLISTEFNARYQVYTQTDQFLGVETITSIYSAANWSEREVWDIYGIIIWNHPDLRRILTDYGFDGFPLRKDFPLSGYVEKVYSHTTKTVEDRKVQLSQELRAYKYQDSWEDEK